MVAGEDRLTDWLDQYAERIDPEEQAGHLRNYRGMRGYVDSRFGVIPLSRLATVNWQVEWVDWLGCECGLAPATVRLYHTHLKRALDVAVKRGLMPHNPAADVRLPRVETVRKILPLEAIPPFVTECLAMGYMEPREYYGPMMAVAVLTGMRMGELCGLTWGNVNTHGKYLTITRQFTDGQWRRPKTQAGWRTVALPARAVEALGIQREVVERRKARRDPRKRDEHDVVFPSEHGLPLVRPQRARQALVRICERIGVEPITPHGLRHTYATAQIHAGADLAQVAKQLGHKRMATTVDLYGHLTEQISRDAADRMDRLVGT